MKEKFKAGYTATVDACGLTGAVEHVDCVEKLSRYASKQKIITGGQTD